MSADDSIRHVLGAAVRIDDHFLVAPIPDELDVRLDAFERPTTVRSGGSRRHADGTYRFIDLADGTHALRVTSPDDRWMVLDPPPAVVVPIGLPARALRVEAWPTPLQDAPPGTTAVRGKLVGAPGATIARRIEIDVAGQPFQVEIDGAPRLRFTRTSSFGEFLFLLPGSLALDGNGRVEITVRVIGHAVTGGALIDGDQSIPFSGATFRAPPGHEAHVRLLVT
jgi:hypothetical protein